MNQKPHDPKIKLTLITLNSLLDRSAIEAEAKAQYEFKQKLIENFYSSALARQRTPLEKLDFSIDQITRIINDTHAGFIASHSLRATDNFLQTR